MLLLQVLSSTPEGAAVSRAQRVLDNPPPPEGSERVWIDFEIFFEFFELKESSQGTHIPPGGLGMTPGAQVGLQNRSKNQSNN